MTPGLSYRTIDACHCNDQGFLSKALAFCTMIQTSVPHVKWAVSLVIAYGHFNLPQGLCVGNEMFR